MHSVMAARPFSIHTVLTSIRFERYEQSDGLKCKLYQEPNELTANLDSWFVLKDIKIKSTIIFIAKYTMIIICGRITELPKDRFELVNE